MAINLKNYTTEVPAVRSIDNIERLLVSFGAHNIMKQYAEIQPIPGKICIALSFIIEVDGVKMPFKLPANVHKVAIWLRKQKRNSTDKWVSEQSNRIAWKMQFEILHLQLSQIEMEQVEVLEILLPYVYDIANDKTYYQKIKDGGFKQLSNG